MTRCHKQVLDLSSFPLLPAQPCIPKKPYILVMQHFHVVYHGLLKTGSLYNAIQGI